MANPGRELREKLATTVAIGAAVSDTVKAVKAEREATPVTGTLATGEVPSGSGNPGETGS